MSNGFRLKDKVRVKNTKIEGIIVKIVDDAVRLEITNGVTPVTDYYITDLELI